MAAPQVRRSLRNIQRAKPVVSEPKIQKPIRTACNAAKHVNKKAMTIDRLPLSSIQAACQAKLDDHLKSYVVFVNDTIKKSIDDHVQSVQSKMDREKKEGLASKLLEFDPPLSSNRIKQWAADVPLHASPDIPPETSEPPPEEMKGDEVPPIKQEVPVKIEVEGPMRIKQEWPSL